MLISQHKKLSFQVIQNKEITKELDIKIREALVNAFPQSADHFRLTRIWFSEPEWNVLGLAPDGEIAGFMAVIERTISVGNGSFHVKVFGPQNVMVAPKWRKSGVVRDLMDIAALEAEQRGIEAGFLFCRRPLADKVYGPLGWNEIHDTVYVTRQPETKETRPSHDLAMMRPLSVTCFPPGDIDLLGPDW